MTNEIRQGTIEQTTATQITSSQQTGVGAVLGGFVSTSASALVEVTQPIGPELAVGQKVYIQGRGEGARVSPR